MVEPNWSMMLWIILIVWTLNAITGLGTTVMCWDEEKKYGIGDIINTIITIIAVILVLFT